MTAMHPELEGLARNRFLQKKFLAGCGIPTAEFRLARNHRELVVAHQALGFPGVLKLQFVDNDDVGPWIVRDFEDVPPVLRETKGRPLLWERFVPVDRVLLLIATRAADGSLRVTPETIGPAFDYVEAIGKRLGIVGTYRVTLLQSGDRLLVDQIALDARPAAGAPTNP